MRANRPERVRDALTEWFREHAEQKLREKSERYAKIVGVAPSSVDIKTFKSQVGQLQYRWADSVQLEDHHRSEPGGGLCGCP